MSAICNRLRTRFCTLPLESAAWLLIVLSGSGLGVQVAQKSLEVGEGAADEGVEWMRNEPYDNTG